MEMVLKAIKDALENDFKGQILKYILIGSRISNSQKDNSDFDIIVVTNDLNDAYLLIKKLIEYISPISVKFGCNIGLYPIKEMNFKKSSSQFINNVIKKGIEF